MPQLAEKIYDANKNCSKDDYINLKGIMVSAYNVNCTVYICRVEHKNSTYFDIIKGDLTGHTINRAVQILR